MHIFNFFYKLRFHDLFHHKNVNVSPSPKFEKKQPGFGADTVTPYNRHIKGLLSRVHVTMLDQWSFCVKFRAQS